MQVCSLLGNLRVFLASLEPDLQKSLQREDLSHHSQLAQMGQSILSMSKLTIAQLSAELLPHFLESHEVELLKYHQLESSILTSIQTPIILSIKPSTMGIIILLLDELLLPWVVWQLHILSGLDSMMEMLRDHKSYLDPWYHDHSFLLEIFLFERTLLIREDESILIVSMQLSRNGMVQFGNQIPMHSISHEHLSSHQLPEYIPFLEYHMVSIYIVSMFQMFGEMKPYMKPPSI